jgi:hypothetical protein
VRHLRPAGICAICDRPAGPARPVKIISCGNCGQLGRDAGHEMCSRCKLADPDWPYRYGASLAARLPVIPPWWQALTEFAAARHHPGGAVTILRHAGRVISADAIHGPLAARAWASRPPSRRTWPRGWSRGPVGAVVAAWPAASLVGSYELLLWLIGTSGAPDRRPPAGHRCGNTACRAAARSAPAAAVDSGQYGRNELDLSAPGRRPTGQPAGRPAAPAGAQHGDGVPGAGADDDAAVAAYRLSVRGGNPLSERKLAQMFGRTSRRWARARIIEARQSPCASGPGGAPGRE